MAKPQVKVKKPTVKRKATRVQIKKAIVVKPYVFQDCHRRTFLLLEEKGNHNRYLTVRDEEMQVIKLPHDLPTRDASTGMPLSQETTSTTDLHPVMEKTGEPYALKKATQKLFDSLIVRTYDATKALCTILGKPIPELTEAEQQARAAAAERLKTARAQRQSNLAEARNTNPQSNLNDKGNATMSTTKKASKKATAVKTNGTVTADTRKITLLVKENPKRVGSASHKRFSLYSKMKTVADFLKAGGTASDISWDAAHKFIKVSA